MENNPKLIVEEDLYEEFEKLDIKTRFAIEFSRYKLSAVFYSKEKGGVVQRSVVVSLLLDFDLEKTRGLRKSDPGAVFYNINGAELSVSGKSISRSEDEEFLFDQFQDGRKILALFREIAANYTALIQHT